MRSESAELRAEGYLSHTQNMNMRPLSHYYRYL